MPAFDTVDHEILLHILEKRLGVTGSALLWFKSYYLSSHAQREYIKGISSDDRPLKYCIPQGSILGSKLFKVYTLPVGDIARHHGLQYQIYADDNDLYIVFKSPSHKDPDTFNRVISNIESCVLDIRTCIAINFLKLNDLKTEFRLIGYRYRALVPYSPIQIGNEQIPPSVSARNLGVIFDSCMTLETHVNSVVSAAYYNIKNIGSIWNHLTQEAAVNPVHAHVTSRLDYCNALLYGGLSDKIMYKVQKGQNVAAKVVTGTNKFEHITPVLNNIHWLPVKFRINIKILLLTFNACHGLAPSYLCDLIDKKLPTYTLRNYDDFLLVEPRTKLKTYSDRAFSKAAPFLWNPLSIDILRRPNVACFKQKLKTYLFKLAFTPMN